MAESCSIPIHAIEEQGGMHLRSGSGDGAISVADLGGGRMSRVRVALSWRLYSDSQVFLVYIVYRNPAGLADAANFYDNFVIQNKYLCHFQEISMHDDM